MHDGMQYDPMQGQGHKLFKVGMPSIFKCYLLRHLHLNYGTISKFDRAGFLISILVFG